MRQPFVIQHPLVQHKMGLIRSLGIGVKNFRELVDELSSILVYEISRELKTHPKEIEVWSGRLEIQKIAAEKIMFVPIIRAGISMMHGALRILPLAKVNFSGIFRDENTATPQIYYRNIIKPTQGDVAIILDPMLATGGSMCETIQLLKKAGYKEIMAVCLICAPEGVKRVQTEHPDLILYTASIDEKLNEKKYILPGLGDAGDRVFETG